MLVQRFRRELRDYDAFVERTILRHVAFSIAILRSDGLTLDSGVWQDAVTYLSRFSRTQLTIVVSGRGYFQAGARLVLLEAGDAVLSDQLRQEREGHGGSPAEILVVEWEPGSLFGTGLRGDARFFHVAKRDVARLKERIRDVESCPPSAWVAGLCRDLAAIGFEFPESVSPAGLLHTPPALVDTYRALGDVLTRLAEHPSLDEVAQSLALSERQTHRRLGELEQRYAHHFSSWRAYLHENRVEWTIQLLSNPRIPLSRVARLAGYRSTAAMHHALDARGVATPGAIRKLLTQRWA